MSDDCEYDFYPGLTQPNTITCAVPPPEVGRYVIAGGLSFWLTVKPCWFHRLMVRWILGWKWRDA